MGVIGDVGSRGLRLPFPSSQPFLFLLELNDIMPLPRPGIGVFPKLKQLYLTGGYFHEIPYHTWTNGS
jgi:hypothetical protein